VTAGGLSKGVLILVDELDRYLAGFARWAREEEILGSS
jgi:hypothetical protein